MSRQFGNIALALLTLTSQIKIFHWQTDSYAAHKATDGLLTALEPLVDQFVEVMQGSYDQKLVLTGGGIPLNNISKITIDEFLKLYRSYLTDEIPIIFTNKNTDLINIRDEMLAAVNTTLYLLTLD